MRSDMKMRRYVEAARAHHDLNPQDEEALHDQHLESLGLSGAAKEHMIKERMASVAAHLSGNSSVLAGISKLDDKSQVAALTKLHEHEQRGVPTDDEGENDNERTDQYLTERKRRPESRR